MIQDSKVNEHGRGRSWLLTHGSGIAGPRLCVAGRGGRLQGSLLAYQLHQGLSGHGRRRGESWAERCRVSFRQYSFVMIHKERTSVISRMPSHSLYVRLDPNLKMYQQCLQDGSRSADKVDACIFASCITWVHFSLFRLGQALGVRVRAMGVVAGRRFRARWINRQVLHSQVRCLHKSADGMVTIGYQMTMYLYVCEMHASRHCYETRPLSNVGASIIDDERPGQDDHAQISV